VKIHNCEQYDDTWWALRKGLPTASRANEIVTPKKGDISTQHRALINSLIAESLGVQSDPMEATEWMLRGTELEPEARAMFELENEVDVVQVGFITNEVGVGVAGCSPDGLITEVNGRRVGFEVKCPKAETHIGYLLGGALPDYYKPQVHMSMAITGIRRWWFMSYHPELQPLYALVKWDEYTDRVLAALNTFLVNYKAARTKLGVL
jgi:hypothetical protein